MDKRPRTFDRWRAGAVASLLAAFTALALAVPRGSLEALDHAVLRWLFEMRSEGLTTFVLAWTHLGSVPFTVAVGLLAAAALWPTSRRSAAFFATAVAGAGLVNQLAKFWFTRYRPTALPPVMQLGSFSFPSGHSMLSMATFLASLLVIARHSAPGARWVVFVGATATVGVGATRVYLGVHYPSDVAAGWILATAWVLANDVWYRRPLRAVPAAA